MFGIIVWICAHGNSWEIHGEGKSHVWSHKTSQNPPLTVLYCRVIGVDKLALHELNGQGGLSCKTHTHIQRNKVNWDSAGG